VLSAENKSFANFPQMEQLIENVEKLYNYYILEEAMEVGFKQLNNKQKK